MPYQDVMNVILPHQGQKSAHVTGHYGEVRAKGPHGGSDFNYEGGQAGVNLDHPTIHSPIAGEVTFVGGQYGTIKIRDAEGNSHEILHTQSQSVKVGQHVEAGSEIGHMGGRGPNGAAQYAQHVHYQMKDAQGHPVNPEHFWKDRSPASHGASHRSHETHTAGAAHTAGTTHARQPQAPNEILREGDTGGHVKVLQERLNALGYKDASGHRLGTDAQYGDHTREAVERFQQAHGLKPDGIAGPQTLEALKQAHPRIDGTGHPDHALFEQSRGAVYRLDASHQRTPDVHSDQIAGVLTTKAKAQGMTGVDHAVLSDDAATIYAVQGELNSPFKRVAEAPTQQAANTSLEESGRLALQTTTAPMREESPTLAQPVHAQPQPANVTGQTI